MPCLTPVVVKNSNITVKNPEFTNIFPCGKCPECLKRKQKNWAFRLAQEHKQCKTAAFITFTYEDEELPITTNGFPSLLKSDFQRFMKRLRKKIYDWSDDKESIEKIKYYAVGEYGSTTERPHYHAILFNVPKFFLDLDSTLQSVWNHGHVQIDECNGATIAYTTKYLMKRLDVKKLHNDDRIKEFNLMSKGLGANYLTPAIKNYYRNLMIPYLIRENGQKESMPQYYRNKIFSDAQKKQLQKIQLDFIENHPDIFDDEKHKMDWTKMQFYTHERAQNLKRMKI